jgi:hypothetical protein
MVEEGKTEDRRAMVPGLTATFHGKRLDFGKAR